VGGRRRVNVREGPKNCKLTCSMCTSEGTEKKKTYRESTHLTQMMSTASRLPRAALFCQYLFDPLEDICLTILYNLLQVI
jgi:hypothetical protein